MLSFLFGRRDEYEDSLRRASTRLSRYATDLSREAAELDRSAGDLRSRELASSRASAAARLALLHSWGLFSLLPTFFEQASLVVRRAYVRAAADAAAVGALTDTAAAAASWSRHLSRLADERAADERAAMVTGARSGSLGSASSYALPLDVDEFCALPASVLASSVPLARVRAREARLTERLLVLDAEIRTLAPALAPPAASARAAALAAAAAAAAADAAAAAAADVAAAAAIAAAGEGALHPAAAHLFPLVAARAAALLALPLAARHDALRSLLMLGQFESVSDVIYVQCASDEDDDDGSDDNEEDKIALFPLPAHFPYAWSCLTPDAARRVDIAVDGFATLLSNAAARRVGRRVREAVAERILGDQRFKEGRLLQAWATRVLIPPCLVVAGRSPPIFARDLPRFVSSLEVGSRPAFDGGDGFYLALLRGAGVGAALAGVARAADDEPPAGDRRKGKGGGLGVTIKSPSSTRERESAEEDREDIGATSPAASSAGAYEGLLSPSVGPLSPKFSGPAGAGVRPRASSCVVSAVAPEMPQSSNLAHQQLPNARAVAAFCSHFGKETAREHFPGTAALTPAHAASLSALAEGVVFSRIHALVFRGIDLIPSEVLCAPAVAPRLPKAAAAYAGEGARAAAAFAGAAGDDLTVTPPPRRGKARSAAFAPPASPADLVLRRDRIWAAKAPLVFSMSAEDLGLPAECSFRLSTECGVEGEGEGRGRGGSAHRCRR